MSGLLETATGHYGETLESATTQELVGVLSAIYLELENRHPYHITKKLEQLHSMTEEASENELLTLAIAAAVRLRLPRKLSVILAAIQAA